MEMTLIYRVVLLAVGGFPTYHVTGARILAMFPNYAQSHWFALKPLFVELSNRGHNITLLTAVLEDDFPPQWEVVPLPNELPKALTVETRSVAQQVGALKFYDELLDFGLELCERLFAGQAVASLLSSPERRFDLFVMEFFNHNCFLALAHRFGAPVVGFSAFGGFSWTTDAVADPLQLSHFPDVMLPFTDRMTVWQRLTNVVVTSYARYCYNYYFIPKADEIVRRRLRDPSVPSISALEANTSLIFLQTHVSHSYPRPHLPNVIETGGMHAQQLKPLPEDLLHLLDSAKDGAIFFSMGTLIKREHFPEDKLRVVLSVFAKLKQIVLWKWDSQDVPAKPPNVFTREWFPQSDVLAHENVRLLVSHGGLQSCLEAVSRGVPLLALPTTAEQRHNVQGAVDAGYAAMLDIADVSEPSLERTVGELLYNPRYRESARLRSRLFHDRPERGVDTAVFWTEYVLRHGGAPHLRSAARDLAWYQRLLLDVAALLLLCAAAVALTVGLVTRQLYRALVARPLSPGGKHKAKTIKHD